MNRTPALIIRITPALRARIDKHCKRPDAPIPMAQFLRQAIVEKLDRDTTKSA